jgi:hypothetical protein
MGMFGAIIFIPLFFQGVLGASATLSGNLQIPMSIAVMITAFISGHLLARAGGHSRNLGIISMGLICLGVFLLSRLTPGSAYWMVVADTVIVGFGMGFSITIFTSVIQNAVPYSQLGVATSSSTFIRSFGGAVGLAILGSAVNNRFLSEFIGGLPDTVKETISMEKLTAMAHNPQALVNPVAQAQLRETLSGPGPGTAVFDQVMQALHQALSSAIAGAFLIGFGILAVGLAATFFLKEEPPHEDDRPVEQGGGGKNKD